MWPYAPLLWPRFYSVGSDLNGIYFGLNHLRSGWWQLLHAWSYILFESAHHTLSMSLIPRINDILAWAFSADL
jgi:hypothetical protein